MTVKICDNRKVMKSKAERGKEEKDWEKEGKRGGNNASLMLIAPVLRLPDGVPCPRVQQQEGMYFSESIFPFILRSIYLLMFLVLVLLVPYYWFGWSGEGNWGRRFFFISLPHDSFLWDRLEVRSDVLATLQHVLSGIGDVVRQAERKAERQSSSSFFSSSD